MCVYEKALSLPHHNMCDEDKRQAQIKVHRKKSSDAQRSLDLYIYRNKFMGLSKLGNNSSNDKSEMLGL